MCSRAPEGSKTSALNLLQGDLRKNLWDNEINIVLLKPKHDLLASHNMDYGAPTISEQLCTSVSSRDYRKKQLKLLHCILNSKQTNWFFIWYEGKLNIVIFGRAQSLGQLRLLRHCIDSAPVLLAFLIPIGTRHTMQSEIAHATSYPRTLWSFLQPFFPAGVFLPEAPPKLTLLSWDNDCMARINPRSPSKAEEQANIQSE